MTFIELEETSYLKEEKINAIPHLFILFYNKYSIVFILLKE